MKLILSILTLLSLIALTLTGEDQKGANITLGEIDGRTWLLDPQGNPFFAHGVTHIGTTKHGIDYAEIAKACKELGFNAYGYGCPEELRSDMPYLESKNHLVPISTYRSDGSFQYVDVFDPKEQIRLDRIIKLACVQNRDNPNLIGYCWTDLGAWPLENSMGENWVEFIRALPDEAPGKIAYREFLTNWKGADDTARDQAFLRLIAREYFRVLGEANRKYDPDHLVFGDRFAFNTIDSDVLEEILPWVDAIAIQPPYNPSFPEAEYDRLHQLTGKPILICDFAIRFKDGDKAIRGWKPQENAKDAGAVYASYLRDAMATDYIIGAFWCNLVDSKPGFSKAGVKQGLFDVGLKPRPELNQAIRDLNEYREALTPKG